MTDLFGAEGDELLARLQLPEPWRGNMTAGGDLTRRPAKRQIAEIRRLKAVTPTTLHPALMSAPGIGWVLAFTIAAEIGEIERFSSPEKLAGYTGLCPRVNQSGDKDRRGPLTKHGLPTCAGRCSRRRCTRSSTPPTRERYQRNKRRLGKQRGAKVAQIDIARRLARAIWHMLSRNQQFAPRGAAFRLAA